MNYAVIGTGKTGGKVVELLDDREIAGIFNTANPVTTGGLSNADVAIIFVPGQAVESIMEPLLQAKIPAVWATTGYEWQENLHERLKKRGIKWLKASNFSLGMNIIRKCIRVISEGSAMLEDPEFRIHEIHHVHKQDAPSGTAVTWKNWLGKVAEITSERKGDIKGIHKLKMSTAMESITLEHEAHDRAVFAEGAIWAAKQLVKPDTSPGFHEFSDLFDKVVEMEWN